MVDAQVTCITKQNPLSSHEHITHLGNPARSWMWSREQVIASIEEKTNSFYVLEQINGTRADIGVVREPVSPQLMPMLITRRLIWQR